jgi:hypothetical protein
MFLCFLAVGGKKKKTLKGPAEQKQANVLIVACPARRDASKSHSHF